VTSTPTPLPGLVLRALLLPEKNFDLPGYRWRLLDGDTELAPGLTVLRTDGHTPGHQSLLVHLPQSGPVLLTGDACYWMEHAERERVPGVVWNPTLALHSIKKIKTIARLDRRPHLPGPRSRASGRP
jgi:glyoxylase-like metal-dependent hydrolase (beta-lactamase superfamily II)